MEIIFFFLDILPAPIGYTIGAIILWAVSIKFYTGEKPRTVVRRNLFIFPSLVLVYTFLFFVSLSTYMKFTLLPNEIENTYSRLGLVSSDEMLSLKEELSGFCLNFMMKQKENKAYQLFDTRNKLLKNLTQHEDFKRKNESVPDFLLELQTAYKANIDSYEQDIKDLDEKIKNAKQRKIRNEIKC